MERYPARVLLAKNVHTRGRLGCNETFAPFDLLFLYSGAQIFSSEYRLSILNTLCNKKLFLTCLIHTLLGLYPVHHIFPKTEEPVVLQRCVV